MNIALLFLFLFSFELTVNAAPVFTSISPSPLPTYGGTVTIKGKYFYNDPTKIKVTLGPKACTNIVSKNDTTLTCVVGAGTGGGYHVAINVSGRINLDSNTAFSYKAPIISAATQVSALGGTVTLSGYSFGTSASEIYIPGATNVQILVPQTKIKFDVESGPSGNTGFTICVTGQCTPFAVQYYRDFVEQCPVLNVVSRSSTPTVFENLNRDEIQGVLDFMLSKPELDITPFDESDINKNHIYTIEYLPPPKQAVLAFLDNNGPNPGRWAKVVVYRGKVPDVKEYKVGPLPIGPTTQYTEYNLYGNIPFNSRAPDNFEYGHIDEVVLRESMILDTLMLESFRANYYECETCLTWTDTAPRGPTRDKRQTWLWFMRDVEGKYMNPVGLEMLIDHKGNNPTTFKLLKVVYNGYSFNTSAQLVAAYNAGTIQKIRLPALTSPPWTSFDRRGVRVGEDKAPPRHFQPQGSRFTVRNTHVSYMGWQFDLNSRPTAGLMLWDIRFKGERIVYELGLQEATAAYSGIYPGQSRTSYLDAAWGMGLSSYELKDGIDCPSTATYLNITQLAGSRPITFKNAICIFEQDLAFPIRRHYDADREGSYYFYGGTSSYALVVRTASAVYNYDYLYDYIFYLNGVVEVKVSTSGYVQGTYYSALDAAYSTRLWESSAGSLHEHLVNYKVDLDVVGTANSFQVADIEKEVINSPWFGLHSQKRVVRKIIQNEDHSARAYNFERPCLYYFVNRNERNKWGAPRGYRIHINQMAKNLLEADAVHQADQWSKYQLAVTLRKDSEPSSSVQYNQATPAEPILHFDSFLDSENITDKDIVAWISMGIFHLPHAEDIPVTTTPGSFMSFVLKPNNYFDEDPSMDLKYSVLIRPDANGGNVVDDNGVPPVAPCVPKIELKPFGGRYN